MAKNIQVKSLQLVLTRWKQFKRATESRLYQQREETSEFLVSHKRQSMAKSLLQRNYHQLKAKRSQLSEVQRRSLQLEEQWKTQQKILLLTYERQLHQNQRLQRNRAAQVCMQSRWRLLKWSNLYSNASNLRLQLCSLWHCISVCWNLLFSNRHLSLNSLNLNPSEKQQTWSQLRDFVG